MDTSTELLKFKGPLTSDRYNAFFSPNLCHVCKSANDGSLILCDKCGMISYCNLAHKKIDEKQHRNICQCIAQLLEGNLWYNMCHLTAIECLQLKVEVKKLVQKRLNRPLCKYETDMFLYAKMCLICHRLSNLHTCTMCFTINFCSDHLQDFYKYHASKCKKLIIRLNMKINLANDDERNALRTLFLLPNDIKSLSNTLDFIGLHIHTKDALWTAKPWTTDLLSFQDYYHSECLSTPLTLYYGMQDANLAHFLSKPVCVIHIYYFSNTVNRLPIWEILFHLLDHKVRKIILKVISPNITFLRKKVELQLCATCKLHQKTLIAQSYSVHYDKYISSAEYERPNVIMICNGIADNLTKKCLTALRDQDCPLLLTSMELRATESLIAYINNILDIARPSLIKNRFRGLSPRIAIETGDVVYNNQYLLIYEKLKNFNKPDSNKLSV